MGLTVHLIYNHCLLNVTSLIQEQPAAMLQGHQDGNSLATGITFYRSGVDLVHMCTTSAEAAAPPLLLPLHEGG